jgi:hypothetical protein
VSTGHPTQPPLSYTPPQATNSAGCRTKGKQVVVSNAVHGDVLRNWTVQLVCVEGHALVLRSGVGLRSAPHQLRGWISAGRVRLARRLERVFASPALAAAIPRWSWRQRLKRRRMRAGRRPRRRGRRWRRQWCLRHGRRRRRARRNNHGGGGQDDAEQRERQGCSHFRAVKELRGSGGWERSCVCLAARTAGSPR